MSHCHDLWNTWFLGVQTVQYWSDLLLWDRFLAAHPGIRTIIELGSGRGGMSLYLRLQTLQRDQVFLTCDRIPMEAANTPGGRLLQLSACQRRGDIFADPLSVISPYDHPLLLFCDAGDKPREFRTFVPILQPGDWVAVHDAGTEFSETSVDPVRRLVKRTFADECKAFDALTWFYERVEES